MTKDDKLIRAAGMCVCGNEDCNLPKISFWNTFFVCVMVLFCMLIFASMAWFVVMFWVVI